LLKTVKIALEVNKGGAYKKAFIFLRFDCALLPEPVSESLMFGITVLEVWSLFSRYE
jgi:hypothetical protein